MTQTNRADIERWLTRRGIPHFIDQLQRLPRRADPGDPVPERRVPVRDARRRRHLDWPWWANVLAVAGGLAVLIGAWAVINRLRGRPALARPRPGRLGGDDASSWLVPGPAPPGVRGRASARQLATAGANLVMLAWPTSSPRTAWSRWPAGPSVQLFRQLGGTLAPVHPGPAAAAAGVPVPVHQRRGVASGRNPRRRLPGRGPRALPDAGDRLHRHPPAPGTGAAGPVRAPRRASSDSSTGTPAEGSPVPDPAPSPPIPAASGATSGWWCW